MQSGSAWQGGTLQCVAVMEENHNVKSFTFKAKKAAFFEFLPGQHITLILPIDDGEVLRTYTIASSPTTPYTITLTNKRLAEGVVTNWMHDNLNVGDYLEALSIGGAFSPSIEDTGKKLLLLSGGVGITPMLSMVRFSYDLRLSNNIAFVHHAQTKDDFICFKELTRYSRELLDFNLYCVSDSVNKDTARSLPSGFLTTKMLKEVVPDFAEREVYCCGPQVYMDNVRKILDECHFDLSCYHTESFNFADSTGAVEDVAKSPATVGASASESIYSIELAKSGKVIECGADTTILAALKQAGISTPFACSVGLCGTCRTLKIAGKVDMQHRGGILPKHEDKGFILICCSKPLTDVKLDV